MLGHPIVITPRFILSAVSGVAIFKLQFLQFEITSAHAALSERTPYPKDVLLSAPIYRKKKTKPRIRRICKKIVLREN